MIQHISNGLSITTLISLTVLHVYVHRRRLGAIDTESVQRNPITATLAWCCGLDAGRTGNESSKDRSYNTAAIKPPNRNVTDSGAAPDSSRCTDAKHASSPPKCAEDTSESFSFAVQLAEALSSIRGSSGAESPVAIGSIEPAHPKGASEPLFFRSGPFNLVAFFLCAAGCNHMHCSCHLLRSANVSGIGT
jgi:hypothetical protein